MILWNNVGNFTYQFPLPRLRSPGPSIEAEPALNHGVRNSTPAYEEPSAAVHTQNEKSGYECYAGTLCHEAYPVQVPVVHPNRGK